MPFSRKELIWYLEEGESAQADAIRKLELRLEQSRFTSKHEDYRARIAQLKRLGGVDLDSALGD